MTNLEYFIVLLSGILLALPFSYPDLFFISWIGLVPFLFVLEKSTPLEGFKKGTLLGIILFIATTGWIYYPLVYYSGLPWLFCILLLIILFILLGLVYGLWAWLLLLVGGKKTKPVLMALSWVAVEFLRYKILSILPFSFIGYTQVNFLHFLQLAALGGVFLISFLVVLINGYFFKLIKEKKLRFLVFLMMIFLIPFIYGTRELLYYQNKGYQSVNVGIVQSNLEPEDKWAVKNIEKNMNYFVEKSTEIANAKLIIWPESSLTFDLVRNEYYRKKFFDKIKEVKGYIQTGSLAIISDKDMIYNSSFLISPEGKVINRYNKVRLVPFGEYLPFQKLVKMVTGIEIVSETPGDDITIFNYENISWKTAICSEILYPELVSEKIEQAGFVVNQSNEAWYKRGNLQQQMWTAATFRAVENRIAVVKSGNKAYGGLITPWGESMVRSHARDKGKGLVVTVPLNQEQTYYQRHADIIGFLATGLTFFFLLIRIIIKQKYRDKNKPQIQDI